MTLSYYNLCDMTDSIVEIPEVGMQLPEWRLTLHLHNYDRTYKCEETAAHASFSPNTGYSSWFKLKNANKQTCRRKRSLGRLYCLFDTGSEAILNYLPQHKGIQYTATWKVKSAFPRYVALYCAKATSDKALCPRTKHGVLWVVLASDCTRHTQWKKWTYNDYKDVKKTGHNDWV